MNMRLVNVGMVLITTIFSLSAIRASAAISLGLPRPSTVLARRDVQREVSLAADQVVAVNKLTKSAKPVAGQALAPPILDAIDAKIGALLDERQSKRLRELQIKFAGYRALFDSEVQAALLLTAAQKAQVAALSVSIIEKTLDESLKAVLTDEQKAGLAALAGTRFAEDKVA